MTDIEKIQAELERLQEKQKVLKAKKDRQQARLNAAKRKERTKRLIKKGAVLEDIQAQAERGLKKAPKVSRVAKADDPAGYADYQAYQAYNQEKERFSETISPLDSKKWLITQLNELNSLVRFTKKITYSDGHSVFDEFQKRNGNFS